MIELQMEYFHTFIDSSAATSFPSWQKLRSSLVICLFIGLSPAKKRNDVTGTRLLEPRMINVLWWNLYWALSVKYQVLNRYWSTYTYQQMLRGYYLRINEYVHALKAWRLLLALYYSSYQFHYLCLFLIASIKIMFKSNVQPYCQIK